MKSKQKKIRPSTFYHQMVFLISHSLGMLDEQGEDEVFQFLIGQQNTNGGFKDRGGRSDLYYSLFGMMILGAWDPGLEFGMLQKAETKDRSRDLKYLEIRNKLKQFVTAYSTVKVSGFIEQCCLALLQKELHVNRFLRIKALINLSRSFWKERYSINLSYRSFVLFLTLDAIVPSSNILKRLSGRMLVKMEVDQHSPCSEVSAKVFLLRMMKKEGIQEQKLLKSFAAVTGGFRAFQHLEHADMLSTAVALFALDFAGSDLRVLKPDCLGFIQQNFVDGAFISGDGDLTVDLEYTFYGLLALGVLAH